MPRMGEVEEEADRQQGTVSQLQQEFTLRAIQTLIVDLHAAIVVRPNDILRFDSTDLPKQFLVIEPSITHKRRRALGDRRRVMRIARSSSRF